jgi:hypothetical protein
LHKARPNHGWLFGVDRRPALADGRLALHHELELRGPPCVHSLHRGTHSTPISLARCVRAPVCMSVSVRRACLRVRTCACVCARMREGVFARVRARMREGVYVRVYAYVPAHVCTRSGAPACARVGSCVLPRHACAVSILACIRLNAHARARKGVRADLPKVRRQREV